MSEKKLKCYGKSCEQNGLKYPKEQLFKIGQKNYCAKHYHEMLQEAEDKKKLYAMIRNLYHISFPTGYMLKQIKDFKEERNYSYGNMAEALDYASRQKWVSFETSKGLGVIPYVYEDAINQRIVKKNNQQATKSFGIKQQSITVNENKFKQQVKKERFNFGE